VSIHGFGKQLALYSVGLFKIPHQQGGDRPYFGYIINQEDEESHIKPSEISQSA
jgi:hypothetical protein